MVRSGSRGAPQPRDATLRGDFRGVLLALAALGGAALAPASLGSCSLDYGQGDSVQERAELPDTVLYGFQHTIVRNGLPLFRLVADVAENFDAQRRSVLAGVGFIEYGADGKPVTSGTCASAIFHTDTENVELSGGIDFRSTREGMGIVAEYLYWDSAKKELGSRPEQVVRLSRDDGSTIRGEGFRADARTRSWNFAASVEGRYAIGDGPE